MMKQAFTLIELLIAVLIIGILVAIALPQYHLSVDKANYSTMMEAVRALKNEQELYYLANGKYATDITELSHVFPAQCNSTGSNCGKFSLQIDTGYVFGALLKDRVEVRNSLTMDFNGNIKCYAYESDGEHGRKVCKSMGGVLQGEENGGCLNHCSIYKLNF